MTTRALNIIIAGGGTGGHLFPGIAIARTIIDDAPGSRVLFVNTGNALETKVLSEAGFEQKVIRSSGLKGLGIFKKLGALMKIPGGVAASASIIKAFRPDVVIGVGGYSSGPVLLAARMLGVKTALHEQNRLAGMTNRFLSRLSGRVYVSFENTVINGRPENRRVTGNPVRKEICGIEKKADASGSVPTVFVTGGSQGAEKINQTVIQAVRLLRHPVSIVHQTGKRNYEEVRTAYEQSGTDALVKPFFTDMAERYRNADLVICRAGATTVAELSAIGKPALFIPFPFAADNHQVFNAQALTETGGAEMIEEKNLSPELLAERISYYAENPDRLKEMAGRAKKLGKPDAARKIADDLYEYINL